MRAIVAFTCLLSGMACLPCAAPAQTREAGAVYRLPAPPDGFDPVAASDADLARYGFPARPNPFGRSAMPYAAWARAMRAAKIRIEPQLRVIDRRHAPLVAVHRTDSVQAAATNSLNWSGEVLLSGAATYGASSYVEVFAQWLLPAVQEPVGSCAGFDVMATWVGIDGASGTSGDVLQAGTEGDTACSNGVTTQDFYPWFEWYPAVGYQITNFTMYRGASVFVVVQAVNPTTANLTFVNLQNNTYVTGQVTAPAGTTLKGSSAEWIVERPTVGGSLGTLADFGLEQMSSEVAYVASQIGTASYDVPGAPLGGRTGSMVTMTDAATNALASPTQLGTSAQVISVEGATK